MGKEGGPASSSSQLVSPKHFSWHLRLSKRRQSEFKIKSLSRANHKQTRKPSFDTTCGAMIWRDCGTTAALRSQAVISSTAHKCTISREFQVWETQEKHSDSGTHSHRQRIERANGWQQKRRVKPVGPADRDNLHVFQKRISHFYLSGLRTVFGPKVTAAFNLRWWVLRLKRFHRQGFLEVLLSPCSDFHEKTIPVFTAVVPEDHRHPILKQYFSIICYAQRFLQIFRSF